MEDKSVLILGTADWQQAIATNQHYVTRELLRDDTLSVTFVESLALRRPQLTKRDAQRILRRLRRGFGGGHPSAIARPVPDRLTVVSPLIVPAHRGLAAHINHRLLKGRIREWLTEAKSKVLWTYSPITYGLEDHADEVVYHCVDLIGKFPGINENVIARGERILASKGAHAVATSPVVAQHLELQGFANVELWENVADTSVIANASPLSTHRTPGRVIFAGNLTPNKVDYRLLEMLADAGLEVVVAGPRAEGGGNDEAAFSSLLSHGVKHAGMLPLEELASEMCSSTVGLIPYLLNDYTRGVSPLKTYEYMAAGLPVVSTALPGVHAQDESIFIEASRQSFVERVCSLARRLDTDLAKRRLAIADQHSWAGRGVRVREKAHNPGSPPH